MALISGHFFQTNGTTAITDHTFDLQMLDVTGAVVGGIFPSLANGFYKFTPGGLPADKRMGLTVSLNGVEKTRLTGLDGSAQRPQTIDILVPGVTFGQQDP